MKASQKIIGIVSLLIVVIIVIAVLFIDVSIEHLEVDKSIRLTDESPKECGSATSTIVERLKIFEQEKKLECFLGEVKGLHFIANYATKTDAVRYLALMVEKRLVGNEENILIDHYIMLEVLSLVVPYSLSERIEFNVDELRFFVAQQTLSDNAAIRSRAISVLAYYKNNEDVGIFEKFIRSGNEDEMVFSIFALVHNCSDRAKEALADALTFDSVQQYLRKYREKETVTRLIADECPVGSE